MKKIERECFAKINLLLKILGKRSDQFHEVLTVMQAIDLKDRIEVWKTSSGISLECDHPLIPINEKNLMVQAALKFLSIAQIKSGIGMRLWKKIPIAAGLGGGSSDAAHTLLALNQLFDNSLQSNDLSAIAASLGSDINFFLSGGTALCSGRGEKVTPIEHSARFAVLLVNPGLPLSTADVYRDYTLSTSSLLTDPQELSTMVITSLQNNDLSQLNKALANDLEGAAIKKLPVLATILEALKNVGFQKPLLSGSGPTLFALSESLSKIDEKLVKLRRYLPSNYSFFACHIKGGINF